MNSEERFISQVERDRVEAKVETESRRRAGKTGKGKRLPKIIVGQRVNDGI